MNGAHPTGNGGTLIHVGHDFGQLVPCCQQGTLSKIGKTEQSTPPDLEAELARVKRELTTVTMERDILKSDGLFREGVAVKYDQIDVIRRDYSIAVLCRIFEVDASNYYA